MPHGSTAAGSADIRPANPEDPQGLQTQGSSPRFELSWTISLFGTAVGAGVLFLPINAGLGGIWPLLIVTILIGPMTYLSHRALSRFVCASPDPGADITVVARKAFGEGVGRVITVLYFLAIFPIVLIYGIGITNTVDSLMVNQLGMGSLPRWLLSGVLIALMMLVMVSSQRIMLIVTQWLVYPLIAILLFVTLYLIPSWKLDGLTAAPSAGDLLMSIWLVIPVLVFAFNHSPAISQFSLAMQRQYGPRASERASVVLRRTAALLVIFTMGFVWSCVLSLGVDGLQEAKDANLPVLSHLANVHGSPFIAYLGPVVALAAIASSFFGHYLGAAEGAAGIVRSMVDADGSKVSDRALHIGIAAFIFLSTWAAAIINPSILSMIESIAGPVIAMILYLMPMYAIRKMPALAPYRGRLSNVFVTIAGLVAVSGIIYGLVS
ncbi:MULTISPECIES: aromatic amino acid transport family protein [Kocuria]|uniref:aromatic amino acid transport family protein n=1 Tax=Kocuria TaxID=57493 RepID=UPI0010F5AC03|nr:MULTISPECIES: aromatic amino acid transport family protein [Kocuria]MCM3330686.1 HAAAP family serine/threonine permease [Kocuria palustris]MCT1591248.1 HAAAP family serine/threonine permease [Kocuria palustris]